PRSLVVAIHPVEVLHCYTAGAPDKIVLASQDHNTVANHTDGQVEKVGSGRVLGRGQVIDDADECSAGVVSSIQLEQYGLREAAVGRAIDRREDAAVHGNQVRSEDDLYGLAGYVA